MSRSETDLRRQRYAFRDLGFEIPDRSWRERSEWLIGLIESVAELCERDLRSYVLKTGQRSLELL
jgi:hypothetical protein